MAFEQRCGQRAPVRPGWEGQAGAVGALRAGVVGAHRVRGVGVHWLPDPIAVHGAGLGAEPQRWGQRQGHQVKLFAQQLSLSGVLGGWRPRFGDPDSCDTLLPAGSFLL